MAAPGMPAGMLAATSGGGRSRGNAELTEALLARAGEEEEARPRCEAHKYAVTKWSNKYYIEIHS